jgi:hypothetical protein
MTDIAMDSDTPDAPKSGSAIYFDGKSNQRRAVTLHLADRLEIRDGDTALAAWAYGDIRRADGPTGMLRLSAWSRAAQTWMRTRPAAAALRRSSAGRLLPRFRSSRWCCLVFRSPPIV